MAPSSSFRLFCWDVTAGAEGCPLLPPPAISAYEFLPLVLSGVRGRRSAFEFVGAASIDKDDAILKQIQMWER